jgi:hypothetical protein
MAIFKEFYLIKQDDGSPWNFFEEPDNEKNDPNIQYESVDMRHAQKKISLNRFDFTDTNGNMDWYLAPESPGYGNHQSPPQPAKACINEIAVKNGSEEGFDFIELKILSNGSFSLWRVYEYSTTNPKLLYEFDFNFEVKKDDLIVIHTNSLKQLNHVNEDITGIKTDSPRGTTDADFEGGAWGSDNTWDVYSMDSGFTATENCFLLEDNKGIIQDMACLSNQDGSISEAFMSNVLSKIWQNEFKLDASANYSVPWQLQEKPELGVNESATESFLVSWPDNTNTTGPRSIQRDLIATDTNSKNDWSLQHQTMGRTLDFEVLSLKATSLKTLAITLNELPNNDSARNTMNFCIEENDVPTCPEKSEPPLQEISAMENNLLLTTETMTPGASYRIYFYNVVSEKGYFQLKQSSLGFKGYLDSLIANYSFETESSSVPVNWAMLSSGSLTVQKETIQALDGEFFAGFNSLTSSISGREVRSNCFTLEKNSPLRLSGYFYTPQAPARTKISFKIYYFQDNLCQAPASTVYKTQTSLCLSSANVWEKNSFDQEEGAIPQDSNSAYISIRAMYVAGLGSGADLVFMDKIEVLF